MVANDSYMSKNKDELKLFVNIRDRDRKRFKAMYERKHNRTAKVKEVSSLFNDESDDSMLE